MSPLRWLSVCCFVVCGWCAGDSFHQQAQAHLEALRKTLDLLETLHQEISFRRSDLNLLCRKLIQDGQLPPETVSLQTLEPFPSLTLEERTRFSDIEQDGSFLGIKVHKEEVIQYEQRAPFDSLEFRFQCAFYLCHLKRTHKFRSIRIICPYALLAGFIPHCCGKEALPGTG